MERAPALRGRTVVWCAAAMMALIAWRADAVVAAQAEAPGKAAPKDAEAKKASVRVAVVLVDPARQPSARPIESATVKVRGEEDSYETDKDGKTRTLVMVPGQKAIIIRPSGADPCQVDVAIKEGAQTVTVLVEMSPQVKCTLQPQ